MGVNTASADPPTPASAEAPRLGGGSHQPVPGRGSVKDAGDELQISRGGQVDVMFVRVLRVERLFGMVQCVVFPVRVSHFQIFQD